MTETKQSSTLRKGSAKLFWTVHQPNCVGISKNSCKSEKTIKSNYFGCVKCFILPPRYDETK